MSERKHDADAGKTPRFDGLRPSSERASRAASASSRKRDTTCEILLRRALWQRGLRYRVDVRTLPGRPDVAFLKERVAVFCDGDFWHGRDLDARLGRLQAGHNAPYWVAKIQTNATRDRRHDDQLRGAGWMVLRYWETDVRRECARIADAIAVAVRERRPGARA